MEHLTSSRQITEVNLLIMLNTTLLTEWTSTRFVHGRPRKSTDQGSIERANQDVDKLLFARLGSLKKSMNRWVSELKYVQYTKNTVKHSALGRSPFEVHFGRTPPDLSVDLMLPQESVDSLNTEDDVKKALHMDGQIIEFSTQTTETTAVPVPRSSTPILPPLSRMTLCQPDVPIPSADVSNQVDRDQQHQPCSSYSPEPVHEYTEVEVPSSPLSSTDELDEAIISELHPVLVQDEDSNDLEVRPLIRTDIIPFVNPNDRLLLPDIDPNSDLTGMLVLIVD